MLRPVLGRTLCVVGRTFLQNNSRFLQCQANLQYFPSRNLIAATKLLVSSASSSLRYNTGVLRKYNGLQVMRRRCTSTKPPGPEGASGSPAKPEKLSLFQKYKAMYKDYWYVMLPVHLVTSAGWFGAFYNVSASGIDVGYYLRKLNISETIIHKITNSGLGDIAVAWALYKVATPIRYAVTLGGTTVSINTLRNMGYIKPAKELMAKGREKAADKIKSLKEKTQK